jgi:transcriptional regulator with XRE-family HTH domain
MPAKASKKKRPRHVVAWVREQLGLTQRQLAIQLGASWHTIQAIENQNLALSERFAYLLLEKTGIPAAWFLRNQLGNPPPDVDKLRERFKRTQYYVASDGFYRMHLRPRAVLFRLYVMQREIANELGAGGYDEFLALLHEATLKGLEQIPNRRVRRRVYSEAVDIIKSGTEKVAGLVISDGQELQRVSRKHKKAKATPSQLDGETSSASAPSIQKERRSAAPAGDDQGQSQAVPSARGNARRSS